MNEKIMEGQIVGQAPVIPVGMSDCLNQNMGMGKLSKTMLEDDFLPIDKKAIYRPSQIPITHKRFKYLTEKYENGKLEDWAMFHHKSHFLICSTHNKSCVMDVEYTIIGAGTNTNETSYAVVTGFYVDESKCRMGIETDYFDMVSILLEELL